MPAMRRAALAAAAAAAAWRGAARGVLGAGVGEGIREVFEWAGDAEEVPLLQVTSSRGELAAGAQAADERQNQSAPLPGRAFGNGINSLACNASRGPLTVLDYTLSEDAAFGVMTHFWDTGETAFGSRGLDYGSDDIVLDYFVDGETSPSISFQPAMAAGQYYAGKLQEQTFPPFGLFNAGEKMGKNGQVAGWYHYYKVPFQRSILVKVRTLDVCQVVYVTVRGHEVRKGTPEAQAGLEVAPGFVVPPNARLQLHRIDRASYQPLSFVPILSVPAGYAGVLYLTSVTISTSPARNSYVEGCWHFYSEAAQEFPGLVLGTGLEDFFDSAYWFCSATTKRQQPCPFAHPGAGLLHFDRSNSTVPGTSSSLPAAYERLSAYRFHDQELIGFQDGARLEWRVGDVGNKCGSLHGTPIGQVSAVNLSSYMWVYTWPLNASWAPAPSSPPIGS